MKILFGVDGIVVEGRVPSAAELCEMDKRLLYVGTISSYGEDFNDNNEKWEEYCSKNKEAFTKKLNAILEQEKNITATDQNCNNKISTYIKGLKRLFLVDHSNIIIINMI